MRILIVSNFYPPHFLGGYELGCHDVAQALEARGHQVAILTSCYGVDKPTTEGNVFRWLHPTVDDDQANRGGRAPRALLGLEIRSQLVFDRIRRRHRPDVVYFWNLARLPVSLALRAEARGAVCYYVSDPWLAKWTEEGWYEDRWYRANRAHTRLPLSRGLMRSAFRLSRLTWTTNDLQLRHVQFCSAFLKQATLEAGRPVANGDVVHWGVNTALFTPERTSHPEDDRRKRLLYVGQLLPHKGVHTAIEALGRLHGAGARDLTLTIVGRCHQPDYDARLRETVAASNLAGAVRFVGPQPRERLPAIYRSHGILVFPSCWDEPFAITPLEAMASELAVVGTTAGGNREIFDDGVNALTFPPGDSEACAAQIHRLAADPEFWRDIAARGRNTVLERFTLQGMVDRIESGLQRAGSAPAPQAHEAANGS